MKVHLKHKMVTLIARGAWPLLAVSGCNVLVALGLVLIRHLGRFSRPQPFPDWIQISAAAAIVLAMWGLVIVVAEVSPRRPARWQDDSVIGSALASIAAYGTVWLYRVQFILGVAVMLYVLAMSCTAFLCECSAYAC